MLMGATFDSKHNADHCIDHCSGGVQAGYRGKKVQPVSNMLVLIPHVKIRRRTNGKALN